MLKNFWYVVENSDQVGQTPRKVQILGLPLVVYRDVSGQPVVLSDTCPHRGGSLSGGWVENGCVRCPYHGWRFDKSGACIEIPANPKDSAVPKKARVDAYPTTERYGWVWAFLGDLPEAERPPLPPLPEFGQPGWKPLWGQFKWNAHYTRVVENGVDIAHTPFVHSNSFGNKDEPEIKDYPLEESEYSVGMSTTLRPPKPKGLWGFLRRGERPDVKAATAIYMPNVTRLDVDLGSFHFIVLGAQTPIDEHTTLTRWVQLRNFFTGDWANGDSNRRMQAIFLEDQATVESQMPKVVPYDIGAELSVKSDAIQIAYRRMRKAAIDRGWAIDTDALRHDAQAGVVRCLPGPSRSEDALKSAWVFQPVSCTPPKNGG